MIKNDILYRKLIHLLTGLLVLTLTYILKKEILLGILAGGAVFSLATYPLPAFRLLHKTAPGSWGTLFFPLGLLAAHLVLYHAPAPFFRIALLLVTLSDTAAHFSGNIRQGNTYFRITPERKSLFGVLAFAFTAWLIHLLLLPHSLTQNTTFTLLAVLIAVTMEVISFRGSDNLSIPLGTALFFRITATRTADDYLFLLFLIPLIAAGGYLLFRWRVLTRAGSMFAALLGIYLSGFLGVEWTVPILFFFVTSVVLTKINASVNGREKISTPRNAWQVWANILPATASSAFYLITGEAIFIFFFIALVAAVTADTWASEIGPLFNKKCFSPADLRIRNAGISGGISFAGSLAALAASFSTAAVSWVLFFDRFEVRSVLLITASGFLASFVDSMLGAYIEPGLLKKKFFRASRPASRERMTPNDLVNIAGSSSAPLFMLALEMV